MVSMSSPIFLLRRLFFCIRPTMTVHPSWPSSGSSSTSSSLMVNWGFIQKVSGNSSGGNRWADQERDKERLWWICSRTYVVSAATRRHPYPPGFFELRLCPFLELIAWEGIRCEVTDLEAGVLAQEVRKWHPVDKHDQLNEKDQRLRIGCLRQLEHSYTVLLLIEFKQMSSEMIKQLLPKLAILGAIGQPCTVVIAHVSPLGWTASFKTTLWTCAQQTHPTSPTRRGLTSNSCGCVRLYVLQEWQTETHTPKSTQPLWPKTKSYLI